MCLKHRWEIHEAQRPHPASNQRGPGSPTSRFCIKACSSSGNRCCQQPLGIKSELNTTQRGSTCGSITACPTRWLAGCVRYRQLSSQLHGYMPCTLATRSNLCYDQKHRMQGLSKAKPPCCPLSLGTSQLKYTSLATALHCSAHRPPPPLSLPWPAHISAAFCLSSSLMSTESTLVMLGMCFTTIKRATSGSMPS